jgi:hypothetical protein
VLALDYDAILHSESCDILLKRDIVPLLFENCTVDVAEKYVHINVFYKTINVNKKDQVVGLTKDEKHRTETQLQRLKTNQSIFIGRKYRTQNGLIDSCFGHIAYYFGHIANYATDNPIIENKKNDKSVVSEACNISQNDRRFKFEMKQTLNLSQYDLKHMVDRTIFLDFEFLPDIFDDLSSFPKASGYSMIFMIGMGFIADSTWEYKSYTVNELLKDEETRIVSNWLADVKTLSRLGYRYICHWSMAEPSILNKGILNTIQEHYFFLDLMKVFKNSTKDKKFVSYSLKHIANTYYGKGCINTSWDKNIPNGVTALVQTLFCNSMLQNRLRRKEKKLSDFDVMKTVVDYNEVDVKVMYELLRYVLN